MATLEQYEQSLMEAYYGELPWLDLPTEPGYYWFRVVPSAVVRGPVSVRRVDGKLVAPAGERGDGTKAVDLFQRQWAGPLGRPVPVEG